MNRIEVGLKAIEKENETNNFSVKLGGIDDELTELISKARTLKRSLRGNKNLCSLVGELARMADSSRKQLDRLWGELRNAGRLGSYLDFDEKGAFIMKCTTIKDQIRVGRKKAA